MGLFGNLFKGSGGDSEPDFEPDPPMGTLVCDECQTEVDYYDIEDGVCTDCQAADYSGPKYCCGAIYEEGEDTCMSCGEPL